MCGRFVQTFAKEDFRQQFPELLIDIAWLEKDGSASYNVAPGHLVWVLDNALNGEKVILNRLQWGFHIISPSQRPKMVINMRLDRLLESKNWEKAINENRRILIPANGWYEWKRDFGKGKNSLPYYFTKAGSNNLLFFAGLIDTQGNFGIVTQNASKDISHIHDRMPLILDNQPEQAIWLQKSALDAIKLIQKLSTVTPAEHKYTSVLVSTKVNKVSQNDASLLHEVPLPPTQGSLF